MAQKKARWLALEGLERPAAPPRPRLWYQPHATHVESDCWPAWPNSLLVMRSPPLKSMPVSVVHEAAALLAGAVPLTMPDVFLGVHPLAFCTQAHISSGTSSSGASLMHIQPTIPGVFLGVHRLASGGHRWTQVHDSSGSGTLFAFQGGPPTPADADTTESGGSTGRQHLLLLTRKDGITSYNKLEAQAGSMCEPEWTTRGPKDEP